MTIHAQIERMQPAASPAACQCGHMEESHGILASEGGRMGCRACGCSGFLPYDAGVKVPSTAHLLATITKLREQIDRAEQDRVDLLRAGNQMANTLYNAAQYKVITEQLPRVAATMVDVRKRWDAAVDAQGTIKEPTHG